MTASNERYTELYKKHVPQLVNYARGAAVDEAEDVVHETFMEVMALPTLSEGELGGLLMQRLKWRITDHLRRRREFLAEDVPLPMSTVDGMEGVEFGTPLEYLETVQLDRTTPAWPSVIDYDTPEALVSADQLRDRIRDIATEAHGREAYSMFCAVMIDGETQARVAKEFRVDQTTVSRTVARVRASVRDTLLAEGYDL